MSIEFKIGKDKKWFLGEDKLLSFVIYGSDGATPIDFTSWAIELVMRKKAKATTVVVPTKTFVNGGLQITGSYNADPLVNTQRLVAVFPSDDTTPLKADFPYPYNIKRTDPGNEEILVYGEITFLQPTAH